VTAGAERAQQTELTFDEAEAGDVASDREDDAIDQLFDRLANRDDEVRSVRERLEALSGTSRVRRGRDGRRRRSGRIRRAPRVVRRRSERPRGRERDPRDDSAVASLDAEIDRLDDELEALSDALHSDRGRHRRLRRCARGRRVDRCRRTGRSRRPAHRSGRATSKPPPTGWQRSDGRSMGCGRTWKTSRRLPRPSGPRDRRGNRLATERRRRRPRGGHRANRTRIDGIAGRLEGTTDASRRRFGPPRATIRPNRRALRRGRRRSTRRSKASRRQFTISTRRFRR